MDARIGDATLPGGVLPPDEARFATSVPVVVVGAGACGLTAGDACARGAARDPFGRLFSPDRRLVAPFRAAKVTGALLNTQGGLMVGEAARVVRADGTPLPNLFAGGGAARGVSGPGAAGYLAGNGLLTATSYGRLAGAAAARLIAAGRA